MDYKIFMTLFGLLSLEREIQFFLCFAGAFVGNNKQHEKI